MEAPRHLYLGVLFFRDTATGMWNAQALEYDISANGPTVEHAKKAFERTIDAYLQQDARHQREPFSTLTRAPQVFWDVWERVTQKQTESLSVSGDEMPPAYVIQAITEETPALTM
jgi:hypothetical protein